MLCLEWIFIYVLFVLIFIGCLENIVLRGYVNVGIFYYFLIFKIKYLCINLIGIINKIILKLCI